MKKKILVILLVLVFLYCIGGVIYSVVIRQIDSVEKKEENSSIININNYDYSIDGDKVTSLYKKEFNSLKSNLESEEIDLNNYVTSIAKLYIIDLYSLNIKSNKYDVTASQYVYLEAIDNFKLKVSETLYKYIEDNSDGKRKQDLPEVSEVIINSIEESSYVIGSNEYQSFVVDIEWLYLKELGYDTHSIITLINDNNIISVVEENEIEQKNS